MASGPAILIQGDLVKFVGGEMLHCLFLLAVPGVVVVVVFVPLLMPLIYYYL